MTTYQEMIDKINKAKADYYQTGRSELSDAEYDRLVAQAEKLGYIETVGAAPVDSIEKIRHEHPMLSLNKCHSVQGIKDFSGERDVVAMWKADGLTCSATYIDGVLTRLETRGNGEVGNNVMFHAKSFENLPLTIDKPGKYVIDGECVIMWPDFEKINEKMAESERYSHARNLAAGSLNQLDPEISRKRHLRFYAWDVIEGGNTNSLAVNLVGAKTLGFDTVKFSSMQSNSIIQHTIDSLKTSAEQVGMPIDGIVFKFDDIKYGKSLGMTGHHPRLAIAYKFEDDCYPTKLKSVTWQVGKSLQITPVANFVPVDISGVIIEKASIHNISIIKQLGLTNGCTCYIKRANDVIPQIEYADDDGDGEIEIPVVCPECGSPTYIDRSGKSEILMCSNPDCKAALLARWETFVSKKGMDIDGLSEQTLKLFLNRGYLTNMFESIYHLADYKNELYKLPGFGKKSVDKLLNAVESSKETDLQHFIVAFSVDGIAEGQAKLLANKFKTFDEFAKACDNQYDFSKIPGFGSIMSVKINNWWVNNHYQMIDVAEYVRFRSDDFMNPPEGNLPLAGKTFVITGKLTYYSNRNELVAAIESAGGKVAGSVSKNTTYLINNDTESSSSKNVKAKSLGVRIISEAEFRELLNSEN